MWVYAKTYRSDLAPVEFLVADLKEPCVLKVQDSWDFLVSVAHDKGSSELIEFSLLQTWVSGRQKCHQAQNCVHVVLSSHFCLQRCENLFHVATLNDIVLHPETLHIVNALLSFFDFHGNIDMRVDELLALRDVHLLDICHVVSHLFDRHLRLLFVDNVLNLLKFATCNAA